MRDNVYDRIILKRIEKNFHITLLIGGITAILSAGVLALSPTIPWRYTVVNTILGILVLLMYRFKDRLPIEAKLTVGISVPVIMGVHSFIDAGFNSGAVTLLLLSNAVAVLFLSRRKSLTFSGISLGILLGLWLWSSLSNFNPPTELNNVIWFMQVAMFILFIVLFQITVYSIRNYLMEKFHELEESISQTYDLAYLDSLTGVPNKNGFLIGLEGSLVGENLQVPPCLVFISVRNLNMINALFTEKMGDRLLVECARYFERVAGDREHIGRIGGNEFALYLQASDREAIEDRLEGLRQGYMDHLADQGLHLRLEFFASYTWMTSMDISGHYNEATLAMTYAKYHEEKQMVAYDEAFKGYLAREERLKEVLKKAVDDQAFYMSYQAKVDTKTERVMGVEALARLELPNYGCVSPGVFIPMVESLNLSVAFGKMTLHKVLAAYPALCHKYGLGVEVSVNISPTFLMSKGFSDYVYTEVEQSQMPANKLILEITEQVAINGVDQVNKILEPIRAKGVRVSLDDFGSGYSSLNYLAVIDVDEIKIDKSFVDQITINSKTRMLVATIIDLSKGYGLDIVAEGVESLDQVVMLREMACPAIQGYYYSHPEKIQS